MNILNAPHTTVTAAEEIVAKALKSAMPQMTAPSCVLAIGSFHLDSTATRRLLKAVRNVLDNQQDRKERLAAILTGNIGAHVGDSVDEHHLLIQRFASKVDIDSVRHPGYKGELMIASG